MTADGRPQTAVEVYLERIAVALERLAEANAPAGPEMVELAEDFPGRAELAEAGVLYYETLPRKASELTGLGLDGPTVNRVLTRLKADG